MHRQAPEGTAPIPQVAPPADQITVAEERAEEPAGIEQALPTEAPEDIAPQQSVWEEPSAPPRYRWAEGQAPPTQAVTPPPRYRPGPTPPPPPPPPKPHRTESAPPLPRPYSGPPKSPPSGGGGGIPTIGVKGVIRFIVYIGAILIAIGVFSFVGSQWRHIPDFVKLLMLLIPMVGCYVAGYWLQELRDYPRTGEALYFLGALIFGATIFLVATMYNVRSNWPDAFTIWMIGVIALAMAIDSYPLVYLGLALGLTALVGYPVVILTGYFPVHNALLLTSSVLLFAATAVMFFTGYSIRRRMPEKVQVFYRNL